MLILSIGVISLLTLLIIIGVLSITLYNDIQKQIHELKIENLELQSKYHELINK